MSLLLISTAAIASVAGIEPVITVTAGRVEEVSSLADPLSVFDAKRIESLNLPQVSDLIRLMPGVSVSVAGPIGSQRSEEHTSELQSLMRISYAVFCLNKKHIYLI